MKSSLDMLDSRSNTTKEKISEPKDPSKKLLMSINRWRDERIMGCTHMECCSVTEGNECFLHKTLWTKLKSTVLQKRKQAQKSTHCTISLIQNSRKGQSNLYWRKQISGCLGPGIWGGMTAKSHKESLWAWWRHSSILMVEVVTSVFTFVKTQTIHFKWVYLLYMNYTSIMLIKNGMICALFYMYVML